MVISINQSECISLGGIWSENRCIIGEELECRKTGGRWDGVRCISHEEAVCVNNCGIWQDGICIPPIVAFDCTDMIENISPGQFTVAWGDLPEGTKKVNVYYKPEGKPEKIYKGIKPNYPIPIIVSGQKPGTEVIWHIEAVNEWGNKVGYSNEIMTVTKE